MNFSVHEENELILFPKMQPDIPTVIKVIGTGGGGSNAVDRMIDSGLSGVEFITVNTDIQDLKKNKAATKVQIGYKLTKGRGAGGKPQIGEEAATEAIDKIKEVIKGSDMVFVTAGMGGGTGTGSAPVIAKVAKDEGILTVAVVTKPFEREGRYRMNIAEAGIKKLREVVDAIIILPNQYIYKTINSETPYTVALKSADEVLRQGIQGITDLITKTGLINPDFSDVDAIMRGQGDAIMGIGLASGENKAVTAAANAIDNPMLEDTSIEGATKLLINISGGMEITAGEVDAAIRHIVSKVDVNVESKQGFCIDPSLEDQIRVTVIATGFKGGAIHTVEKEPIDIKTGEDTSFIKYEEWDTIREKTKRFQSSIPPRNYHDVDLEVPTVIRERQNDAEHNEAGHRDALG
jgi:cell division protein FtsZ